MIRKERDKNTDLWGIWASRFARKRHQLLLIHWTIYSKILCWYWRVELGKNVRFWGKSLFNRSPGSTIIIGDSCRFRSSQWSNMVGINRNCCITTLDPHAQLKIGSHCGFSGTSISAAESVVIEDWVICGANVTITDTDWHNINAACRGQGKGSTAPVKIGSYAWLGLNVTVLKGVTIGERAVIGANSTVVSDIPSDVIAAGNPARVVKSII